MDEMNQVTSPEYIFERKRAGVPMPQSEEIVELVPQERMHERMEQQIVGAPVPRNIVETIQLVA